MATTLWDKFQAAVEWLNAGLTRAGIVTIAGAESSNPLEIQPAVSVPTAAPTVAANGRSVEGRSTVDFGIQFSIAGESATFRPYLYDGVAWHAAQNDIVVQAQAGDTNVYLDAFDCETWNRVYLRMIVAPTSGTARVTAMPTS